MSPRARLLARLRQPAFLVPEQAVQRIASLIVLAALIASAVVALVQSGHRTPTALPPTPPPPASTPSLSIGRSTSTPPRVKPRMTHHRAAAIRCGKPDASAFGGHDPARICVPDIGVDASVMQLGLNSDRTVQVPPLSRVGDAGWYKYSATPGAVGPTVILGHVDSAEYGAGVFYRLGQLRSGDRVVITSADAAVATYRIDRVQEVSKSAFPTQAVYGPTSGPAIRLVTCGGQFDSSTGSYLDNIIAYGTLQGVRRG